MSRRWVSALVALLLVLVVAGAGVAWWSGALDGLVGDDDRPETALDVPPPAGLELPEARAPQPVLEAPSGPAVARAALRRRVQPLLSDPDLGKHVGFAAYDLTHDRPIWTFGGVRPYIPASTLKVMTAVAALEALGGDHVFTTSTVLAEAGRTPRVILVGGGDPLLSGDTPRTAAEEFPEPATLTELANRTADALAERGISRVSIGYDVSRYTGPAESPRWKPGYVPEEVPPISPLWVDKGADPANPYTTVTDPARMAANRFADLLAKRGIIVAGSARQRVAGAAAASLAEVESPPVRDIVAHVLDYSDNAGAEVLLREVAIATGRPPSFQGGAAAVRAVLADLGVPLRGVEIYDGSGLSRANRVSLDAMLATLRVAADADHPGLREAVTGMSVAGFTGTLAYRFTQPAARAGLGWVRAKTGTLSHVHGLAGTVVDRDGVGIAFVALVDRVPLQDTLDARALLDRIAAAVAACGCRR